METAMSSYHTDTTTQKSVFLRFLRRLGSVPTRGAPSPERTVCDRFHAAVQRVQLSKAYDPACSPSVPYGYFHGRPIIGATTGVTGGIYVSAEHCEALVIDDSHGLLRPLALRVRDQILSLPNTKTRKASALRVILEATQHHLRHDPVAVSHLEDLHRIGPDRKVALDVYIAAGVGLNRHRILLAAYLIEALSAWGLIGGSYELSLITRTAGDESILYTSTRGRAFLVHGGTRLSLTALGRRRALPQLNLSQPGPGAAVH